MIYLHGRGGLGDAIYARPFVRAALARDRNVMVETSWPWVFSDLPVKPVKRMGGLRVQAHHGDLVPADVWAKKPKGAKAISLRYRWGQLAREVSILEDMELMSRLRPNPIRLDLPRLEAPPLAAPYAVVRPPAIRLDYPAPSREPPPEYLSEAADRIRARGIPVVTVGSWIDGLEEPNGPPVPADVRYERGELTLPALFALVAGAAIVVSAPCWLIPATLATGTPHVVIAGGCGGRNNRRALVDRRLRHSQAWLLPDGYCMCRQRDHGCPKIIPEFAARFEAALGPASKLAGVA